MVESGEDRRQRRSQEQRSAETRRRILDATVECLQEYGYAGTSTLRVVERAGVTRGALTHHFASKAEMVAAAVSHIAASRTADAIVKLERAQLSADPVDAGLDLLWAIHDDPVFVAVVELWVAARTDPELRRRTTVLEQAATSMVVDFARALFGPDGDDPALRHAIFTAMDVVRGILLMKIAMPRPASDHDARWQRAKADLRVLFEHALARQSGRVSSAT